ncbi:putative transcriptional regulator [Anaerotaenia torta]|uniref:ArsR/SmtB family transcription factor n=1 Tax=Anaerotaenia torta TaxID=433293 RepID=UPI003D190B80
MKDSLKLNLKNKEELVNVGKAFSSAIRIDILEFLSAKPAIITDVASHFNIPLSSAALHIRTLENAGLISVQPIPGSKGAQKLCGVLVSNVNADICPDPNRNARCLFREDMPIGCYLDYHVSPPCGIVSDIADLGAEDSICGFFSTERYKAQLIWLTCGYLEYRFSNTILKSNSANKIQFTFEICSEALGYNPNWRSDVSIWMNNTEIGILQCPGDYGGRRGKLNPYWWSDTSTQYGDLRKIWITEKGCFIDEKKVSDHTISSLSLNRNSFISFKIGVKPDAEYLGGMNLFGEKFGDYPQNIVMEVFHEEP